MMMYVAELSHIKSQIWRANRLTHVVMRCQHFRLSQVEVPLPEASAEIFQATSRFHKYNWNECVEFLHQHGKTPTPVHAALTFLRNKCEQCNMDIECSLSSNGAQLFLLEKKTEKSHKSITGTFQWEGWFLLSGKSLNASYQQNTKITWEISGLG